MGLGVSGVEGEGRIDLPNYEAEESFIACSCRFERMPFNTETGDGGNGKVNNCNKQQLFDCLTRIETTAATTIAELDLQQQQHQSR